MNQVAAAVFENARFQIEFPQTSARGVPDSLPGEVLLELRLSLDSGLWEGCLVLEQKCIQDSLTGAFKGVPCALVGGFRHHLLLEVLLDALLVRKHPKAMLIGLGKGVVDGKLVFEDHQRYDIAVGAEVVGSVEKRAESFPIGTSVEVSGTGLDFGG